MFFLAFLAEKNNNNNNNNNNNKKKQCTGIRNIEFWISHWRVVGIN